MKKSFVLSAVLLLMWSFSPGGALAGTPPVARAAFHDAMRKLWEDHVVWTRLFVISTLADLPDRGPTTDRLLRNQSDIGDAIKPFYGDDAGNRLTALLKEHITTAAEVVAAARANDAAKLDATSKRWSANADEIASFLSGANAANWPPGEMKAMMQEHLRATTEEVVSRLKSDWDADVAAYEKVNEQILHMADMLAAGIINQFPARFSN